MRENSIKRNAVLNVIYTIANIVFPMLTYPYVARILLAENIGKVSFFTSVSNYAVMIGSLGISTYGIRAVAKVRDDKTKLSKTATELLTLNMMITIAVTAVLALSTIWVKKFSAEPALLLINLLIVLLTPLGLNWLYSGLEQYDYITKRTIVFKIISLILIFVLVKEKKDYPIYAGIIAFSAIGAFLCNLVYSRKFVSFKMTKSLEFKKHFRPMMYLFASILAVSVYTNLDTIMLGFINGNSEVGLYSVATKVKWLLLSAVNAVSAVLLPRLSNYISNNKIDEYNSTLKKSVSFIFLITFPFAVFFIVTAKECILILGGTEYLGAVRCMQILMPILVISGFSNVTGNQILIPKGEDSKFLRAVVVGAVADIILNILLMPRYGCTGAAIATLIAELMQASVQLYYAKQDIIKNIDKNSLVKALIASVVAGVLTGVINQVLDTAILIALIISAGVFGIIYLIFLLIMREKYIISILNSLFRIKKF